MNDDRRHEEAEVIKRRRQELVKRVAEARKQGKSQRQIAEDEGISRIQAREDLEESSGGHPPAHLKPMTAKW